MYNPHSSAPSSHHHSNSASPPNDNHSVTGSNDFSAFTANLVSIAAEASNVEDDVSVNLNHHRQHHPDVDVTLIHQSIEQLVNEGRSNESTSKEFRHLQQQFARHNGDLSTTDIEQTTDALMQMAQSSLTHQNPLHSPSTSTDGSRRESSHLGKLVTLEDGELKQDLKDKDSKLRKSCQFCGKSFSHRGSLGRHLDLKRGTRLHPAAEIDIIRADVKRRGDQVEIKSRRAKRARLYNSREDVKIRARNRRKSKELSDRAHSLARENFIKRIGLPSLPPHPSFAYVVLYFLPPDQWPHDPPTTQTYTHLETALQPLRIIDIKMFNDYVNKVNVAFEQWSVMNKQSRMEIWAREQRRVAEAALGRLSLYDLGSREIWLKVEAERITNELRLQAKEEGDANQTGKSMNGSENEQERQESLDSPSERISQHNLLPKAETELQQDQSEDDDFQAVEELIKKTSSIREH